MTVLQGDSSFPLLNSYSPLILGTSLGKVHGAGEEGKQLNPNTTLAFVPLLMNGVGGNGGEHTSWNEHGNIIISKSIPGLMFFKL